MSDVNNTDNGDGVAERALREGLRATALSPEAVQRWINQSTLQAARLWKHFGIRPAAAWLPMSPG